MGKKDLWGEDINMGKREIRDGEGKNNQNVFIKEFSKKCKYCVFMP